MVQVGDGVGAMGGPLGSGQVGKTVNNLLHRGEIALIVEAKDLHNASAMADRAGGDLPVWRLARTDGPST